MNPRGETDGTPMCALAGMAKSKAQRPVHCGRRFGGTALPENVDRPRSLARKRIAGAIACQSKRICRQGNSAIGDLSRSSLPVGMPPIAWLIAPGSTMLPKSPRRSTRRTGGGANPGDGIISRVSSKRMYAPSSNHALAITWCPVSFRSPFRRGETCMSCISIALPCNLFAPGPSSSLDPCEEDPTGTTPKNHKHKWLRSRSESILSFRAVGHASCPSIGEGIRQYQNPIRRSFQASSGWGAL